MMCLHNPEQLTPVQRRHFTVVQPQKMTENMKCEAVNGSLERSIKEPHEIITKYIYIYFTLLKFYLVIGIIHALFVPENNNSNIFSQ